MGMATRLLKGAFNPRRFKMGKYFIAWLLGVPAFVLVIIYLIF